MAPKKGKKKGGKKKKKGVGLGDDLTDAEQNFML